MLTLKVAQPFQDVPDPSTEFDLRLLEIIAVSIHNLAIHIFKECHPNGGPHEENMGPKAVPALEHPQYNCYSQYPNKTIESVGYFAETVIFGGVVLFDRGESGNEVLCPSCLVYPT